MIPTLLAAGLVAGLIVRSWWSIPVLAVGWVVVVALAVSQGSPAGLFGAAVLGATNAAVGVAVGRGMCRMLGRSTD